MLVPFHPIPIKDRVSIAFVEFGQIDVQDNAFVVIDQNGIRTHIPVGGVACLMLEPGTRITHEAIKLAAEAGTLVVWVGEAGVRLYAAGQPGGARSDKLLHQAQTAFDDTARLKVVRHMYAFRFREKPPDKRSVDQLRGMEGARVKETYKILAEKYAIPWQGRRYDVKNWGGGDTPNRALSAATSCLYGVCEAAILAAGYAPAIGFLHTGKPRSFVFDVADLFKFETVVPAAFEAAAQNPSDLERNVRLKCRDMFRTTRLLQRIIPTIEEVINAGGLNPPKPFSEALPPAFVEPKGDSDDGHRG
ncbi:MAG: type I-E CRISPR-associated endonuclease Cas1e [Deltaproteobacteria bacterium]|nr:type I-E CRISPR-associated endonuclease Cas1e [Deltaproteobacteria bacterium]